MKKKLQQKLQIGGLYQFTAKEMFMHAIFYKENATTILEDRFLDSGTFILLKVLDKNWFDFEVFLLGNSAGVYKVHDMHYHDLIRIG